MVVRVSGPGVVRPFYFVLGWCCFGLGAVGVVVPGLPTVPLMLVALWGFSRSSRRFHDWLYHHRVFGPPLQQWRAHRVIPARAKVVALLTMAASLGWMLFAADMPTWLKALVSAAIVGAAVYVATRPSRPAAAPVGPAQTGHGPAGPGTG
jgi:uncharacterized membrane protein YbaN (DUF454 family)